VLFNGTTLLIFCQLFLFLLQRNNEAAINFIFVTNFVFFYTFVIISKSHFNGFALRFRERYFTKACIQITKLVIDSGFKDLLLLLLLRAFI